MLHASEQPIRPIRLRTTAAAACAMALAVVLAFGAAPATAATFDPNYVMSDGNFRAADSMTQAEIQAFLAPKTGPLASLVTTDHTGVAKPASQIIAEACQAWGVSPAVMLTLLQKEQSLWTRTTLVTGYSATLDWAIGMGCPDGSPRIEKYRGFGNQVWYGAQSLDAYGEPGKPLPSGSYYPVWVPGSKMKVATYTSSPATQVVPVNLATYKLFTYNPVIGAKSPYGDLAGQTSTMSGNALYWWIFNRYFGDPAGTGAMNITVAPVKPSFGTVSYAPSRPRKGRKTTFAVSFNQRGAVRAATSTLTLYHYEQKTVRKKVGKRTKKVKVWYWRQRAVQKLTPDSAGTTLKAAAVLKQSGKWRAVAKFPGSPGYAPSASKTRSFTVK